MKCPFCGTEDSQVKDSRPSEDAQSIRRRRECPSCKKRFTTFERLEMRQIMVVKQDKKQEIFEPDKVRRSLVTALRKRPININDIDNAVISIEQKLNDSGKNEISTREIGDLVMQKLKKIDFVAYIRYASVYNEFNNADDFLKVVADK